MGGPSRSLLNSLTDVPDLQVVSRSSAIPCRREVASRPGIRKGYKIRSLEAVRSVPPWRGTGSGDPTTSLGRRRKLRYGETSDKDPCRGDRRYLSYSFSTLIFISALKLQIQGPDKRLVTKDNTLNMDFRVSHSGHCAGIFIQYSCTRKSIRHSLQTVAVICVTSSWHRIDPWCHICIARISWKVCRRVCPIGFSLSDVIRVSENYLRRHILQKAFVTRSKRFQRQIFI